MDTSEDATSRPSLTVWTIFISGKMRWRSLPWKTARGVISIHPGLPAASATGFRTESMRARAAPTRSAPSAARNRLRAALSRSSSTIDARPPCPLLDSFHCLRIVLDTSSPLALPATNAGRPFGEAWNLASTGIISYCEERPRRRATIVVPLRPVPPTKIGGRTSLLADISRNRSPCRTPRDGAAWHVSPPPAAFRSHAGNELCAAGRAARVIPERQRAQLL